MIRDYNERNHSYIIGKLLLNRGKTDMVKPMKLFHKFEDIVFLLNKVVLF